MIIFAVDFDGTLSVGKEMIPNTRLFLFLRQQQAMGNAIILNTCRSRSRLKEAVEYCARNGLRFNAVNENLPFVIKRLGYNPRKIFADVYIDDKAQKP